MSDRYSRVASLSASKRALLALRLNRKIAESAAKKHSSRTKRLVASVIPKDGQPPPVSELRSHLSQKLPEYMLPSAYVFLDAIPLTSTGKVDRRSLPTPSESLLESEADFVAPHNDVEEVLAGIWSDLLGRGQVSTTRNFFELGGDSLTAAQVIYRVRDIFQVELPVRKLFEAPTVAGLSQVLVANEKRPGQTEKIAKALKRVRALSPEETRRLLEEKRKRN
ncbi:MAG TPA: phosphopantetheine-binding protein [Blastocatellia bacterium]|jgi:acyl carrier protein|nr:phosphopantetheine-binding protein [Blastocatellia bacterium]